MNATLVGVTLGGATNADELLQPSGQVTRLGQYRRRGVLDRARHPVQRQQRGLRRPGDLRPPRVHAGNLGDAAVKIYFNEPHGERQAWYANARSFRTATPVRVRAGQTRAGIDQILR